jgi:basic membrane protein A and related proteins
MNRLRFKLILCILAIALSGIPACTQSPDCFRKDVFCAALVTDTRGLMDLGLNQDTWTGLQHSKADGVVDQIAYIESVDARDYEKNISFFVKRGYDVIVTSGVGMGDTTLRSADLYADSVFIGINQPDEESIQNFISVTFPEDQMGFFAGALAARLSQTKIIGAVCETSGIAAMWRYCEGFRAGAAYADDSVDVLVAYREDGSREKLFIDEEWGFENAQNLIGDGADVLFAAGGETGVGALQAAAQAKIDAIGAERDQRTALTAMGEEGSSVVTSVLGRASSTIQELMRKVKDGELADAAASPIGYVPFEAFVPKSLAAEMDQILLGLSSGSIKTNVPGEKP